MKMYEILELSVLGNSLKDRKMPLKTTYKFARLMHEIAGDIDFYQTQFNKIVKQYGVYENGVPKLSKDGSTIIIVSGKEEECKQKIQELQNLNVTIDNIKFTLDELEGIDLTLSEMTTLIPLIEE